MDLDLGYLSKKQILKRLGICHSTFHKRVRDELERIEIGAGGAVRYSVQSVLAYEERLKKTKK